MPHLIDRNPLFTTVSHVLRLVNTTGEVRVFSEVCEARLSVKYPQSFPFRPNKACVTFIFLNVCTFQGQQVIYTANTAEYVMTLGVDGVPVVTPVGGSMVPLQASYAQASQPHTVLAPVSGGIEGQSAMVQVVPTTAMPGTMFVPQVLQSPPSVWI